MSRAPKLLPLALLAAASLLPAAAATAYGECGGPTADGPCDAPHAYLRSASKLSVQDTGSQQTAVAPVFTPNGGAVGYGQPINVTSAGDFVCWNVGDGSQPDPHCLSYTTAPYCTNGTAWASPALTQFGAWVVKAVACMGLDAASDAGDVANRTFVTAGAMAPDFDPAGTFARGRRLRITPVGSPFACYLANATAGQAASCGGTAGWAGTACRSCAVGTCVMGETIFAELNSDNFTVSAVGCSPFGNSNETRITYRLGSTTEVPMLRVIPTLGAGETLDPAQPLNPRSQAVTVGGAYVCYTIGASNGSMPTTLPRCQSGTGRLCSAGTKINSSFVVGATFPYAVTGLSAVACSSQGGESAVLNATIRLAVAQPPFVGLGNGTHQLGRTVALRTTVGTHLCYTLGGNDTANPVCGSSSGACTNGTAVTGAGTALQLSSLMLADGTIGTSSTPLQLRAVACSPAGPSPVVARLYTIACNNIEVGGCCSGNVQSRCTWSSSSGYSVATTNCSSSGSVCRFVNNAAWQCSADPWPLSSSSVFRTCPGSRRNSSNANTFEATSLTCSQFACPSGTTCVLTYHSPQDTRALVTNSVSQTARQAPLCQNPTAACRPIEEYVAPSTGCDNNATGVYVSSLTGWFFSSQTRTCSSTTVCVNPLQGGQATGAFPSQQSCLAACNAVVPNTTSAGQLKCQDLRWNSFSLVDWQLTGEATIASGVLQLTPRSVLSGGAWLRSSVLSLNGSFTALTAFAFPSFNATTAGSGAAVVFKGSAGTVTAMADTANWQVVVTGTSSGWTRNATIPLPALSASGRLWLGVNYSQAAGTLDVWTFDRLPPYVFTAAGAPALRVTGFSLASEVGANSTVGITGATGDVAAARRNQHNALGFSLTCGGYVPSGIRLAPQLRSPAWITLATTTTTVAANTSEAFMITGFALGMGDMYAKLGSDMYDCRNSAPGTDPAGVRVQAGRADIGAVTATGSYRFCVKARQDWEPTASVVSVVSPTTQSVWYGSQTCRGVINLMPAVCGCYFRREGSPQPAAALVGLDFPLRPSVAGSVAVNIRSGCCKQVTSGMTTFAAGTGETWGTCQTNSAS